MLLKIIKSSVLTPKKLLKIDITTKVRWFVYSNLIFTTLNIQVYL